jgi:hypothetical protein
MVRPSVGADPYRVSARIVGAVNQKVANARRSHFSEREFIATLPRLMRLHRESATGLSAHLGDREPRQPEQRLSKETRLRLRSEWAILAELGLDVLIWRKVISFHHAQPVTLLKPFNWRPAKS